MEKISEIRTLEFKYDSEDEREKHVKWMESQGFECSGEVRKSDDSLFEENRTFYWYAKFGKHF